jgi:hypothetical protein
VIAFLAADSMSIEVVISYPHVKAHPDLLQHHTIAAPLPTVTTCSKNGFCYCVQQSLVAAIGRKLTEIREAIKTQTQAGMAVPGRSCP